MSVIDASVESLAAQTYTLQWLTERPNLMNGEAARGLFTNVYQAEYGMARQSGFTNAVTRPGEAEKARATRAWLEPARIPHSRSADRQAWNDGSEAEASSNYLKVPQ